MNEICPDCKGTKVYQGFTSVEPCKRCCNKTDTKPYEGLTRLVVDTTLVPNNGFVQTYRAAEMPMGYSVRRQKESSIELRGRRAIMMTRTGVTSKFEAEEYSGVDKLYLETFEIAAYPSWRLIHDSIDMWQKVRDKAIRTIVDQEHRAISFLCQCAGWGKSSVEIDEVVIYEKKPLEGIPADFGTRRGVVYYKEVGIAALVR